MTYSLWFSAELANDMKGTNETWGVNQGYIVVVDADGKLHQVTRITRKLEPSDYKLYKHSYEYKFTVDNQDDIKVLVSATGRINDVLAARLGIVLTLANIKARIRNFYEPKWTPTPYKMERPVTAVRRNVTKYVLNTRNDVNRA